MNNKTILIIYIFFNINFAKGQESSTDCIILWNDETKLSWNNFKGNPNNYSEYSAITSYVILNDWSFGIDSFTINTSCFFKIKESWVIDSKKSSNLLLHEQIHFDLAELYSRLYRKELKNIKYIYYNDVIKLSNVIYDRISKELKIEQDTYDKETCFSTNIKVQKEWIIKVKKRLSEFEDYKEPIIKLKNNEDLN